MEDTKPTTNRYYTGIDSGSALTVIQLLSRLAQWPHSHKPWIVIPGTRTSGSDVILGFNVSVWPASIRWKMASLLFETGGVLLESHPLPESDCLARKLRVRRVKKPGSELHVTTVEPVMDDEDQPSSPTS